MPARSADLAAFREKIAKELRAGLVSVLLLLVIERAGPAYGYRILRILEERSGGVLAFQEGTAYPLLQNLERRRLVTSFWREGDAGPSRKYYETTAAGRRALAQAIAEWRALEGGVDKVIRTFEVE